MARPIVFYVVGRGHFPIDMLRYDCAYPRLESDAAALMDFGSEWERSVTLVTHAKITPARWESFGWHVTPASAS